MGIISLTEAQNILLDLSSDFSSFISNDFVLTEWTNKGVISKKVIQDGIYLYPDIIIIEILTALNLKREYDYKLREIAEARKYLNLGQKNIKERAENKLLNFINLERTHHDKKVVIKKAIQKMNSIKAIKNIIDDLYEENKKLEIMADYSLESFKARRKIKKTDTELIN